MERHIKVIKKDFLNYGKCNFCSRPPSKKINIITGTTLYGIRMCDECLDELFNALKK